MCGHRMGLDRQLDFHYKRFGVDDLMARNGHGYCIHTGSTQLSLADGVLAQKSQ